VLTYLDDYFGDIFCYAFGATAYFISSLSFSLSLSLFEGLLCFDYFMSCLMLSIFLGFMKLGTLPPRFVAVAVRDGVTSLPLGVLATLCLDGSTFL
jgi:hypothetical protein